MQIGSLFIYNSQKCSPAAHFSEFPNTYENTQRNSTPRLRRTFTKRTKTPTPFRRRRPENGGSICISIFVLSRLCCKLANTFSFSYFGPSGSCVATSCVGATWSVGPLGGYFMRLRNVVRWAVRWLR